MIFHVATCPQVVVKLTDFHGYLQVPLSPDEAATVQALDHNVATMLSASTGAFEIAADLVRGTLAAIIMRHYGAANTVDDEDNSYRIRKILFGSKNICKKGWALKTPRGYTVLRRSLTSLMSSGDWAQSACKFT